jgi:hypothetical protein
MSKRKNTKRKIRDDRMTPTPELHQHGVIELPEITQRTMRVAARRKSSIESLYDRGIITDQEFTALGYYRDQVLTSERTLIRDSLNREVRVPSERGPSAAITSAAMEAGRIERDLGSLCQIARAVCVDDMSLNDWCVSQYGGHEKYDGKGKFVAIVSNSDNAELCSIMDIKMAARRIVR